MVTHSCTLRGAFNESRPGPGKSSLDSLADESSAYSYESGSAETRCSGLVVGVVVLITKRSLDAVTWAWLGGPGTHGYGDTQT